MTTFTSFDEILNFIRKNISKALKNEVASTVRKVEQKHIDTDVYGQYTPVLYQRRGMAGRGLIASENIVGRLVDDLTLRVTNETPPYPNAAYESHSSRVTTNKNLPVLIEYGESDKFHYDFPYNLAFIKPRPFTQKTYKDLVESGDCAKALCDGLKKRGIDAKTV